MKNVESVSYSRATEKIWSEQTVTGDTNFVYTQTSTLKERRVLRDNPKDSIDVYYATGGLITPNCYGVQSH